MTLRRFHRANAIVLAVFISMHLLNHALALAGPEKHIAGMAWLRDFYRSMPVELMILALFGLQILAGILLALRRGKPNGYWAWAQIISGGILALFLLQHLGAVIFMRLSSPLDTNFFWAASVVSTNPVRLYFIPYYWLGVTAVFVHIAAALHFCGALTGGARWAIAVGGGVFAALVVAAFSGAIHTVTLPPEYLTYLKEMYGF